MAGTRAALVPVAFAALLVLAPGGAACHVGPGTLVASGVAATAEGAALASIAFEPCEGTRPVTITLASPQGEETRTFPALLEILVPDRTCLWQPCGSLDPLAALFRISAPELGFEVHGVSANAVHYAVGATLQGSLDGRPVVFATASA